MATRIFVASKPSSKLTRIASRGPVHKTLKAAPEVIDTVEVVA